MAPCLFWTIGCPWHERNVAILNIMKILNSGKLITVEEVKKVYEEEFDIDEVLFDMFPNATTEEELQDELDCIWND